MTIEEHISRIPFFEGLTEDQTKELAKIVLTRSYDRGNTIFSEGEVATGFHAATKGKVKIFKLSPDGKEQILHIFGPWEPFGEVPVFEGRKFPANALALEKTETLFFPRNSLRDLIRKNPDLSFAILAVLSRRLRRFTVMVDDLSLKDAPARLSSHLLYLSQSNDNRQSLDLGIPRTQLAALLGTMPETLSRIFTKMINEGIIETQGKRIMIMDRKILQELADGRRKLS